MSEEVQAELRDAIGRVITVGALIAVNDYSNRVGVARVVDRTAKYVRFELLGDTTPGKKVITREPNRVLLIENSPDLTMWLLKHGS